MGQPKTFYQMRDQTIRDCFEGEQTEERSLFLILSLLTQGCKSQFDTAV